jgi:hypothetical protein
MKAELWLEDRLADSPPDLRERLSAVIETLDVEADLAGALLEAACRALASVRGRLHRREAAYDLLLADGLFTLACEAAARDEPESLVERCRAMGPDGRLGSFAAEWTGSG